MDGAAGSLQLQNIWMVIVSPGLSFVASSLTVPAECLGLPGVPLVVWSSAPAMPSFPGKTACQFPSVSDLGVKLHI